MSDLKMTNHEFFSGKLQLSFTIIKLFHLEQVAMYVVWLLIVIVEILQKYKPPRPAVPSAPQIKRVYVIKNIVLCNVCILHR